MPLSWNEVKDHALVFSKEQATNYFLGPQKFASPILEKTGKKTKRKAE